MSEPQAQGEILRQQVAAILHGNRAVPHPDSGPDAEDLNAADRILALLPPLLTPEVTGKIADAFHRIVRCGCRKELRSDCQWNEDIRNVINEAVRK